MFPSFTVFKPDFIHLFANVTMSFLLYLLLFPHTFNFSANESREVSHLLITDALVPVSEDEEKKSGGGDVDKSGKRELKCKTPASTSQEVKRTS